MSAATISGWLADLRRCSLGALIARLLIVLAGVVALVLPGLQSWDQLDVLPWIGAVLLVRCVRTPDSDAALVFVLAVTGGWLLRAPSELSPALVSTGWALVVLHLASAFAAQMPSYGQVDMRALRRWWLPAAVALAAGPVVAVAAAGVRHAGMSGSLALTVAALTGVAAAVWFAAGGGFASGGDSNRT